VSGYCDYAPGDPLHAAYHNSEYGFPQRDDKVLFERLILEINQAGLSWGTILKKRESFAKAYRGFDPAVVAKFGTRDVARLLADAGIIRNRLKVAAAIENAKRVLEIKKSHGSFAVWLDAHHPLAKDEWVNLFKKTFVFTGGEITGEFLMSLGYLPHAHAPHCPIYKKLAKLSPPWMRAEKAAAKTPAVKKPAAKKPAPKK
jgi:DNA-3-methyladenine glycosylase I